MNERDARRLQREKLMALSGEERVKMASEMFDSAVRIALASFPEGLSKAERRRALFLRLYGNDFDPATAERIADAIAGASREEEEHAQR